MARSTVTLSIRGRIIQLCSGANGAVTKAFDWKNAFADAGIIGGLSAVTAYGSSVTIGIPELDALKAAVVTGLSQFFIFLALKRGLAKEVAKP